MGSIITSNGESLVLDEREREIPTSIARSLLCWGMLIKIVNVVGSEGHFGSMSSERERVFSEATPTFVGGWMRAYE